MVLIADSGATKTDWRIVEDKDTIRQAVTSGINPHYQQSDEIAYLIKLAISNEDLPEEVYQIYFYGAGCSSPEKMSVVEKGLLSSYPKANIEVYPDIIGVARALCGHTPGIVGILGTGSASCSFNGKAIERQVPSLGYILGDEGSGAHLGKILVSAYLRDELPTDLSDKFKLEFNIDKELVLSELNEGKAPSKFLGNFARFLHANIQHRFCYELAYGSFMEFLKKYVIPYPGDGEIKCHFCGSIAFYFSNVLTRACAELKLPLGKIVQSPIAGLTLYHLEEI